jgi:hypothetical protein
VAALFFAKVAKVIFLAVAGFGAVFMKYFKRKPAAAPAPVSMPSRAEQDTVPAALADKPPAPPTA